ncbi:aminotransferase class V-fold PLP-dependent enzyme [Hominisplanchenecus murintestinalis]|uniref:Aminotransferase class V-fold PLP-dependent enzyme n=1 Tax=Hominisplanchenecus murintestinalis TaxID=2941517 RepID=A0AC61QWG9_9FIRM|nr:aminotransferase class I/II-fold pyridoxal phosphate-dependent enzyme [Hominisplanchenecus murintestinalis]TGX97191.1 aminotransferase class V-fold PLP-dependent enzyme [Hominisplanchenecus murintestinalis]
MNLYDKLLQYQSSEMYPFHMPGHKRRKDDFANPFLIDITEIEGFDNLHHAEGILKDAQDRAAALYHSEETYFLVNGSTCGILAAVSACMTRGGKILMARNCHKAAYHAAYLRGLDIEYLYPEKEDIFGINGGIHEDIVEKALEEFQDIQAVMITSPTYDGVVSNVEKIAQIVHRKGIPLIVDEAHGAHFGFHEYFPKSSVEMGADLVIHSLHKTLPSLTQTALLHVNGNRVDRECLRRFLDIYQTSSPSYVFMAGMDSCVCLLEKRGGELFESLRRNLEVFYKQTESLGCIYLANHGLMGKSGIHDFDRSKLVISVRNAGFTGNQLANLLRNRYHLELEMAGGSYGLALTSISDTEEGFLRLSEALKEIDACLENKIEKNTEKSTLTIEDIVIKNEVWCRIHEALESPGESVLLEKAEGKICREFVYLYPPGIPMLVPGEIISREVLGKIRRLVREGYSVQGMADYSAEHIQVMNTAIF